MTNAQFEEAQELRRDISRYERLAELSRPSRIGQSVETAKQFVESMSDGEAWSLLTLVNPRYSRLASELEVKFKAL